MIKAVLFDLDGTLVNSLEDLADACNYALECYGYPTHDLEKYKYFVGSGMQNLIHKILPEDKKGEEAHKQVYEKFYSHYSAHSADKTALYPDILPLLTELKNRGIKIAIVTNKADAAAKGVAEAFLGKDFCPVYGQRAGVPVKPAPDLALMAMKDLGVEPYECAFVGDSGADCATGVNSGSLPIGVLWGFRKAEELKANGAKHLVNKPLEILEIIDNYAEI